jgi:hypothetical protein
MHTGWCLAWMRRFAPQKLASSQVGRCQEEEYISGAREGICPGAAIPGTWFDQYLIPQNELRLLQDGSDETFHYDETLHIIKVIDNSGNEIA